MTKQYIITKIQNKTSYYLLYDNCNPILKSLISDHPSLNISKIKIYNKNGRGHYTTNQNDESQTVSIKYGVTLQC